MILLVTPSERRENCAQVLHGATGHPAHVANTLQAAIGSLRIQEYSAVVIDQFLLETEPDECDLMLRHLGSAVPIYVNCAISGAAHRARGTQRVKPPPEGRTDSSPFGGTGNVE
jgi:hypothetical protein